MPDARRKFESKGNLAACLERMSYCAQVRNALLGLHDPSEFAQPLLDAIKRFEQTRIPYALVGSFAAMYYGRARSTGEIDFLTSQSADALGFHFEQPICVRKDALALQILSRAQETQLQGHQVRIAEPHDLIAMGLRSDKIADDYDISEIVRSTPIDDAIVQQRVTPEQFSHYLEIKKRN